MKRWAFVPVLVCLLVGVGPVCGWAQLGHVYVATYGSNVDTGDRSSPFYSLSWAVDQVAAGGIVSFLDPCSFGMIYLNKSITVDGSDVNVWLLPWNTAAFNITAGTGDTITIRDVTMSGLTVTRGILLNRAQKLLVENVEISGCTNGIEITPDVGTQIVLRNVSISNCSTAGISVVPKNGVYVPVSMENVSVSGCPIGVSANSGSRLSLKNCDLSMNTTGLQIQCGATPARAHLDSCIINNGNTGIQAGPGVPLVRMDDCTIANNQVGLSSSGGTFSSAGNNAIIGNINNGVTPTVFALK